MSIVEVLQAHHDRAAFDCGDASLNDFLRRNARQNADRNVGVTHVVVPVAGSSQIMGYYTLVTRTIDREIVPEKKIPSGPLGVVLLGRLAVDLTCQRQGLGKRMLLRAMRQTEEASRNLGIYALVLDAIDDQARDWYLGLGWGFSTLLDDPNHLYLPIATIRAIGLAE